MRSWLLPVFGESGRTARLVCVRLSRCREATAIGRYLHRVATGEFLAGRLARFGQGAGLHSAWGGGKARGRGARHRRAAIRRTLRKPDEGTDCLYARAFRGGTASNAEGECPT